MVGEITFAARLTFLVRNGFFLEVSREGLLMWLILCYQLWRRVMQRFKFYKITSAFLKFLKSLVIVEFLVVR